MHARACVACRSSCTTSPHWRQGTTSVCRTRATLTAKCVHACNAPQSIGDPAHELPTHLAAFLLKVASECMRLLIARTCGRWWLCGGAQVEPSASPTAIQCYGIRIRRPDVHSASRCSCGDRMSVVRYTTLSGTTAAAAAGKHALAAAPPERRAALREHALALRSASVQFWRNGLGREPDFAHGIARCGWRTPGAAGVAKLPRARTHSSGCFMLAWLASTGRQVMGRLAHEDVPGLVGPSCKRVGGRRVPLSPLTRARAHTGYIEEFTRIHINHPIQMLPMWVTSVCKWHVEISSA